MPTLESRGIDADGRARAHLSQAALRQHRWADQPLTIRVPLPRQSDIDLRLTRFEITTAETKFLRADSQGRSATVDAPRVLLLRGEAPNEPGSRAYLALDENGNAFGSITRASGESFEIKGAAIDAATTELVIREGVDDLPDFSEFCVVIPSADEPVDGGGALRGTTSRGPRVLNVAIEGDQSYVNLFGGSVSQAQAYVVAVLGAVSDIYMRDLDMKIILRQSRLWPDGGEPFGAHNISGFRDWWVQNNDMTGLNLVHLFSGRRDTSYGGVAYLASGCSNFAFGISAFLLGAFKSPLELPGGAHLWNWDVIVIAHEMGHNLGTLHTHDYSPPVDTCTSGPSQRGTIMSYCHTTAGGVLNTDLHMHARVANFIAGNNPPDNCLWHDCNGNGVNDATDIELGTSFDFNENGIPDSCEDCNQNGVIDTTEIAGGAPDVNGNGLIDSCEPDCNANGIPDSWEIQNGTAPDGNGNGIPDGCEPDCNTNGVPDFLDILNGTSVDVDRNSVPDDCQDCNGNGIVDWIDVDRAFNVFIAQSDNSSPIREYHARSGVGVAAVGPGLIDGAVDLTFGPDRQLYIVSQTDNRIVKMDVDSGTFSTFVSAAGGLASPSSLTFGPDGHLYVANVTTSNVRKYDGNSGAPIGVFVGSGSGGLSSPRDIVFGPNGNLFVISGGAQILQYNGTTGVFVGAFAANPAAELNDPRSMVFLPSGHLLVTNRGGNRITRYDTAGGLLGKFNDSYPLTAAASIAIGPNRNVYAARTTPSEVRVIEYDVNSGRYLRSFVRGDAALISPTAIAFRPHSPNDVNRNGVPDICEGPVCVADVAPSSGDGVVNVSDLLAVINAWGTCPPGCLPYCDADITFDCTVNVSDLLAIINAWGPCP